MKYLTMIVVVSSFLTIGDFVFAQAADDVDCNKCVDSSDLAKKSVGSGKLKKNAVTTNKIADGAITAEKLAPGVGGGFSGYRIRDSLGSVVGEISLAEAVTVKPNGAPPPTPIAISMAETNNERVLAYLDKSRITSSRHTGNISYLDDACATPFVQLSDPRSFNGDIFPANYTYVISQSFPDPVALYQVTQSISLNEGDTYYRLSGSTCTAYVASANQSPFVILATVIADLEAIFPPPYTIEYY